ncbi:MAG: ISKra4 family transposase, partial [Deltaproteobacteria bacterium]|nr:ISKra4 family transposase [Deltaproteobacteria bacterium]
ADKKPVPPDADESDESIDAADLAQRLERLKWNLWHGNVRRALQIVDLLEEDLEIDGAPFENGRKLHKAIREFGRYIAVNRVFVPNYGDRYRHGEAISTAFVESAVNQVVSKRMVKQQQMRWTQQGAHLLLQIRTQALNGDLRGNFCRWYPGMERDSRNQDGMAAAA